MRIIEPCCYAKQLGELIDLCSDGRSLPCAHFFSYSDWDVTALLDTLSGYAQGGTVYVAMVRLDVSLISAIRHAMSRTYIEAPDNPVKHSHIQRMILLTQPGQEGSAVNQRAEVRAQLGEYIDCGRLVVCEDNIGFRFIAAQGPEHSLVVQGSINAQRSNAMQMFTVTASKREFEEVAEMMEGKGRTKSVFLNNKYNKPSKN